MESKLLIRKTGNAVKWSTLTQVFTKMISPVTNMILARLLAPEAFGVVATVNMVISFSDMFTDAGFQKYLVQHEFADKKEQDRNTAVAFWTNLFISLFLWAVIIVFRNGIAGLAGNSSLGNVIAVAGAQLPMTSFSSIQMSLCRREFNFKKLFYVQSVTALIPLFVTIPLAASGLGYWSIIIGSTCGVLTNAVILTVKSKWKPVMFYSFPILKEMLSFSAWTLVETVSIWLTSWIDMLIIGSALSDYYLGLYKNSLSMVNSLMAIITASIMPVLFASLSRLQDNKKEFDRIYFKFQKILTYFVFPIGMGLYLYNDLATRIMFGSKWEEASPIIGIWALTSSISIIFSYPNGEAFRAMGKPKISFSIQILYLFFLVPLCLISLRYGFWALVYSRALIRILYVIISSIFLRFVIKIRITDVFKNIMNAVIFTLFMVNTAIRLRQFSDGTLWQFITIGISAAVYLGLFTIYAKDDRNMILKAVLQRGKAEADEADAAGIPEVQEAPPPKRESIVWHFPVAATIRGVPSYELTAGNMETMENTSSGHRTYQLRESGRMEMTNALDDGKVGCVKRIAVAGTGYVGLVAGVCFAEVGHQVTCVDIDKKKVFLMKKGISPIYEADLEDLMRKNYSAGRIDYTTDYKAAYREADAIFIGVGTPEQPDGSANLSHIATVARQIAESIEKDCLVVVKSTVPVGTNDKVEQFIKDFLVNDVKVEVASNPEFLAQGTAVHDTLHAARIVIGTESKWAEEVLMSIYEPFNLPIVSVSRRSAEMIKYASNDFLALKISYMNDIANLCELVGADIQDVARGMSFDERIGSKFLNAGIGYGGSCFPKDTKALKYIARQNGYELRTIKAAIDVNKDQKIVLYNKAARRLITFSGLKAAVLGLTFKPGTDDLREAPSLANVPLLLEHGAEVYAYDPAGKENFMKRFPEGKNGQGTIKYVDNAEEALKEANVCFIFTEWNEIKALRPSVFKELMRTPLVYDGRNIYDVKEMMEEGVEYYSIGRPCLKAPKVLHEAVSNKNYILSD